MCAHAQYHQKGALAMRYEYVRVNYGMCCRSSSPTMVASRRQERGLAGFFVPRVLPGMVAAGAGEPLGGKGRLSAEGERQGCTVTTSRNRGETTLDANPTALGEKRERRSGAPPVVFCSHSETSV